MCLSNIIEAASYDIDYGLHVTRLLRPPRGTGWKVLVRRSYSHEFDTGPYRNTPAKFGVWSTARNEVLTAQCPGFPHYLSGFSVFRNLSDARRFADQHRNSWIVPVKWNGLLAVGNYRINNLYDQASVLIVQHLYIPNLRSLQLMQDAGPSSPPVDVSSSIAFQIL